MKHILVFEKHVPEIQRDSIVIALRKAGFKASRETSFVRTDATLAQANITWGNGCDLTECRCETLPEYHVFWCPLSDHVTPER